MWSKPWSYKEGLDIDAEKAAKERFLKTTVPAWLEKAKSNGRLAQK